MRPDHTPITLEHVISFVSQNPGRLIPTIGGRATFQVIPRGPRAFVFLTQSGGRRNENHNWIGKSLKVFDATASFTTSDYTDTVNASYVLGLFEEILADRQRATSPLV